MDFIKIKKFCVLKDIINKVKRQLTEEEEIFAYHLSKESWYPEYMKYSFNSTTKRQTTQLKNGQCNIKKDMCVCVCVYIYITVSFFCAPETNTIL